MDDSNQQAQQPPDQSPAMNPRMPTHLLTAALLQMILRNAIAGSMHRSRPCTLAQCQNLRTQLLQDEFFDREHKPAELRARTRPAKVLFMDLTVLMARLLRVFLTRAPLNEEQEAERITVRNEVLDQPFFDREIDAGPAQNPFSDEPFEDEGFGVASELLTAFMMANLQASGAQDLREMPEKLENDVHPLFAPTRFHSLDYRGDRCESFEQMITPALRLAGLIVKHMVPDFWLALKEGKHFRDRNGALTKVRRRKKTADMGKADHKTVEMLFDELTGFIRSFTFLHDKVKSTTHGRAHTVRRPDGSFSCHIRLNPRFLEDLRSAVDEAKRRRVLFMLAITIVHEVAHAAHIMLNGPTEEPCFEGDSMCELGWAFERRLLGGVPGRCGSDDNIILWASSGGWPWSQERSKPEKAKGRSTPIPEKSRTKDYAYIVDDADIQSLFDKPFWREAVACGRHTMHLRLVGGFLWNGVKLQALLSLDEVAASLASQHGKVQLMSGSSRRWIEIGDSE